MLNLDLSVLSSDIPGPTGLPKVADTTKSSILLEWNKPTYDGGALIRGYVVEMAREDSEEFDVVSGMKEIVSTQYNVTNLLPDLKYKYGHYYHISDKGIIVQHARKHTLLTVVDRSEDLKLVKV